MIALQMRIQLGQILLGWFHWCWLQGPFLVQPVTSAELAQLRGAEFSPAVLQLSRAAHLL